MAKTQATFRFKTFSVRQKKILTWWLPTSPVKDLDGVIADGAIRSGKTIAMSLSFVLWAMHTFTLQSFGMCGKTIGSFRRNVLFWLQIMLRSRGYTVTYHRSDSLLTVRNGDRENYFYIFGGRDERSQDLIQGVTLAGVFFDEVVLMPQSFVNQATGRCSVDGSKFWFNCNPEGPQHWFRQEWILKHNEKNLLYLHFTMEDNLSLTERIKERYRSMYDGVFYDRFVRGLWVVAEGLIYPAFDRKRHTFTDATAPQSGEWFISIDYGIQNPFSAGLWCVSGGVAYRMAEYYHDGRTSGQRTDEEHADAVMALAGKRYIKRFVIDPSATSFIACLRKRGLGPRIQPANNDVIPGIANVATVLKQNRLLVHENCKDFIRETGLYSWDNKAAEDKPVKQNDHAMDDTRYFVRTIFRKILPAIDLPPVGLKGATL